MSGRWAKELEFHLLYGAPLRSPYEWVAALGPKVERCVTYAAYLGYSRESALKGILARIESSGATASNYLDGLARQLKNATFGIRYSSGAGTGLDYGALEARVLQHALRGDDGLSVPKLGLKTFTGVTSVVAQEV